MFVFACCGTLKKVEKPVCGFKNASRDAGTHGDVSNFHTGTF